jgi:proline iminopeptidase
MRHQGTQTKRLGALLPASLVLLGGLRVAGAQAPRDGYVISGDSVRLYYRMFGNGPDTIVVLHGGPGMTMDYLMPDLAPLRTRHTLIAYDQRGSGRSPAPHDSAHISLTKHLSDLDVIRRRFRITRLTLLGHSWGGKLAAIYASRHPEAVVRLILVDPGAPMPDPSFAERLVAWADSGTRNRIGRLRQAARESSGSQTCRAYWQVFIRGYWSNPNDSIGIARMRGDICGSPTAMRDMDRVGQLTLASVGARDYSQDVRVVRVPVLIIAGRNSPMPWENAQTWATGFPDARLLLVSSGHLPHVEQPELVFDAMETFLQGNWPSSARKVERRLP